MKKSQVQVGKNFIEKIIVLSSKLCLKLYVYLGSRSDIFYRLPAYQSCYYDVNSLVALGPKGVVPSKDQHISRGLLLFFNT